jgi:hypothetical protein
VIRDSLKRYLFEAKPDSSLRFKVSDYFSPPMPQFTYRARNAQGGLVEGVLTAQIAPLRSIRLNRNTASRFGSIW